MGPYLGECFFLANMPANYFCRHVAATTLAPFDSPRRSAPDALLRFPIALLQPRITPSLWSPRPTLLHLSLKAVGDDDPTAKKMASPTTPPAERGVNFADFWRVFSGPWENPCDYGSFLKRTSLVQKSNKIDKIGHSPDSDSPTSNCLGPSF